MKHRRAQKTDDDLTAVAPVVQLIDDAEPDPQLFAQIEAALDREDAIRHRPVGTRPRALLPLAAALCVGVLIGAGAVFWPGARQGIVAQSDPSAPWVSLGSVTLRGQALRSFVRAKCHGQTHFFITMHGFDGKISSDSSAEAPPLMEDGEKILMECIF